jgi:hypothetical protein
MGSPLMTRPDGLISTLVLLTIFASAVAADDPQIPAELHFANDIVPVFSRYGCNSSGCHGKAEGQNGFRLSVFGFDPGADYVAVTQESRGRRISPTVPEQSLLLKKVSGGSPHGGGVRIRRGSFEYRLLHQWIASGAPSGRPDAPHVSRVRVEPTERVLSFRATQQLKVIAEYSDGREMDVTRHARFQSNRESIAEVDERGFVTVKETAGDVAIMAAYLESIAMFSALVPRESATVVNGGFDVPAVSEIDKCVDTKLKKLNISASPICDDATFLRRVSLDIIGRLPTPKEARSFLAETSNGKRADLVDSLLKRPEYADYWALKWSDWLRVDRQILGHQAAYSYYKWIRDSFASNKPMDQFARELVLADGPVADHPAGYFYKVAKDPGEAAAMLSQSLLGVRIDCAKCHHHPFDRWSQDDYYGMQAFFTPIGFKGTPRGESLIALRNDPTTHPRTGALIYAHPLGTPMPSSNPSGDRRLALADWLTAPANPWFARNVANRVWAHFLGRGLVEPVDDVRSTNPPTNPELLDVLANELINHKFDAQHLIRTIAGSRTYQASADVNDTNARDEQNYSRALFRRLEAEVLLDAICDATGVPEKFDGVAMGSRAVQLWDSQVSHYFLTTTGRPSRTTVCECERVTTPTVSQVLHSLNSPNLEDKLSHESGRLALLDRVYPRDAAAVVDELYLAFFSRMPTTSERDAAIKHLTAAGPDDRRTAIEDLGWSLMNSLEFVFNH